MTYRPFASNTARCCPRGPPLFRVLHRHLPIGEATPERQRGPAAAVGDYIFHPLETSSAPGGPIGARADLLTRARISNSP